MNKKILIAIISFILLALGVVTYTYFTKEDEITSLNMIEKKWINNNKNKVVDISIFNEVPVLDYHGQGIIFDYLSSLEENTGLEFNKIAYKIGEEVNTDYSFRQVDELKDNDVLLYEDNYVLVTKNGQIYTSLKSIDQIAVGILNSDLDKINTYLLGANVTYKTYESVDQMILELTSEANIQAIAIPKIQYLDLILNNNLTISYNMNEYKKKYVLTLSQNSDYETLNKILKKYYSNWRKKNYDTKFNDHLLKSYFEFSQIESQNVAKFHSKRYNYGFIENKPFDTLYDGDLVGINSKVITSFAKMSGIAIEYKNYKNYEDLVSAFNSNEIDFFFNAANSGNTYKMDVYNTVSPYDEKLIVLSKESITVNSVNSLLPYTVSVVKGSKVEEYLKKYGINIKEYNNIDDLVSNRKEDVIVIDSYNYQYYVKKGLKNYIAVCELDIDTNYTYIVRDINDNKDFEKLLSFYLTISNNNEVVYNGLNSTLGLNTAKILIRNIFIIVSCLLIVGFIIIIVVKLKPKKRKKRNTNLSKDDKLRYIDMLTSLKNRNYLNDNIEDWDESEVYPQTIIIVDLNDVAYINDNYGHAEGDSVIKEAANILIKNQLPNTEIIRTNGNEFLIYLVSYDEKQVISYMRKLNKEFKELAHGFGAAIGYSIITDAIKTIDDAVNEATIDMRNNKEEASN